LRYPVTFAAVLISLALCLFNSTGYDLHNFIFFMFSPPAWISDVFYDIHATPVWIMYALTIVSYGVIGYVCDRIILAERRKRNA
jgi:hypothetical protein